MFALNALFEVVCKAYRLCSWLQWIATDNVHTTDSEAGQLYGLTGGQ